MTEFRAPPPPPELDWNPEADETEEEIVTPHINPKMIAVAVGLLLIGICIGALMFSSSPEPAKPQGLTNIVQNPDIITPLRLCGRSISETDPCILYIVNHTRFDKKAQDFFQRAADLTGRTKPTIEIENLTYAKLQIPPGYFAKIKIPPFR